MTQLIDHAVERPTVASRIVAHIRRDLPLLLLDLAIVPIAYLVPLMGRAALAVRGLPSAGDEAAALFDVYFGSYLMFVPVAAVIHIAVNRAFGLYGEMWRYAGMQEARRLLMAGFVVFPLILAVGWWWWPFTPPLPRSVLLAGPVLAICGFGAIRFQSRLFAYRRRSVAGIVDAQTRVLMVGAGEAGAMVLGDLMRTQAPELDVVGLVDDDVRKQGMSIHGVRVVGGLDSIPTWVDRLEVDQLLLAIPSATGELVRRISAMAERADVALRVLPSVQEIVGGSVTARDIRDLRIEDLLGRQQVEIDLQAVASILRGRRVLVTGAGGSIGSEIVRQVATFGPEVMILLEHDETHLHELTIELGERACIDVLADIRDRDRMFEVFLHHRPDIVFHAAAHKHVPILETYPEEAVFTNVMGTANVVDAAVAAHVDRFVMVSTDKAVRPVSVMGSTKWLAEQVVRSVQEPGRDYCAVRFGNVLGSRGSVIPIFLQQIQRGGPVTVTDPEMRRYFMSIPEAVRLVLEAAALSGGGEVLTLDMGEPVKIGDLARRLIRLAGRVPERDIAIEVIGRRPGEKLVEDIEDPADEQLPTSHPGIVVSRPPVPDRPALRHALQELERLVGEGDRDALAARICEMASGGMALSRTGEVA